MPGLKSVTHVSNTSVTYVSGLYTREGRGDTSSKLRLLLDDKIFVGLELTSSLYGKQSRRQLDRGGTKHRKFDLLISSVVTVTHEESTRGVIYENH
jgi:hypothetical protein